MVARHYPHPHRFICVTDNPAGIDPDVEILPDFKDYADIPSPHGGKNPSCYRRLRLFHPDAGQWFGERYVSMDLDILITGDLTPLWHRKEDVVFWGDTHPKTFYNGSMMLMTAGARPKVWRDFNPQTSPKLALGAKHFGSDQGWISYCLGPGEAKWTKGDGVYSFRNHIAPHGNSVKHMPNGMRVCVFHGRHDPWSDWVQYKYPWVKAHYC